MLKESFKFNIYSIFTANLTDKKPVFAVFLFLDLIAGYVAIENLFPTNTEWNIFSIFYFMSKNGLFEIINQLLKNYLNKTNENILLRYNSIKGDYSNYSVDNKIINLNLLSSFAVLGVFILIMCCFLTFGRNKQGIIDNCFFKKHLLLLVNFTFFAFEFLFIIFLIVFFYPTFLLVYQQQSSFSGWYFSMAIIFLLCGLTCLYIQFQIKTNVYCKVFIFKTNLKEHNSKKVVLKMLLDCLIALEMITRYTNSSFYALIRILFVGIYISLIYIIITTVSDKRNKNYASFIVFLFLFLGNILMFDLVCCIFNYRIKIYIEYFKFIGIFFASILMTLLLRKKQNYYKDIVNSQNLLQICDDIYNVHLDNKKNCYDDSDIFLFFKEIYFNHTSGCTTNYSLCESCNFMSDISSATIALNKTNIQFYQFILDKLQNKQLYDSKDRNVIFLKATLLYLCDSNKVGKVCFYLNKIIHSKCDESILNNVKYFYYNLVKTNSENNASQIQECENFRIYYHMNDLLVESISEMNNLFDSLETRNFNRYYQKILETAIDVNSKYLKIEDIFETTMKLKIADKYKGIFIKFAQMFSLIFNKNFNCYSRDDVYSNEYLELVENYEEHNHKIYCLIDNLKENLQIKSFSKNLSSELHFQNDYFIGKSLEEICYSSFRPALKTMINKYLTERYRKKENSEFLEFVLINKENFVSLYYFSLTPVPTINNLMYVILNIDFSKTEEDIVIIDNSGEIIKISESFSKLVGVDTSFIKINLFKLLGFDQFLNMEIKDIFKILEKEKIPTAKIKSYFSNLDILNKANKYNIKEDLIFSTTLTNYLNKLFEVKLLLSNNIGYKFHILKFKCTQDNFNKLTRKTSTENEDIIQYNLLENEKEFYVSQHSSSRISQTNTVIFLKTYTHFMKNQKKNLIAFRMFIIISALIYLGIITIFIIASSTISNKASSLIAASYTTTNVTYYSHLWTYQFLFLTYYNDYVSRNNFSANITTLFPKIDSSNISIDILKLFSIQLNLIENNSLNEVYQNSQTLIMENIDSDYLNLNLNFNSTLRLISASNIPYNSTVSMNSMLDLMSVYLSQLINSNNKSVIEFNMYILNQKLIDVTKNPNFSAPKKIVALYNLINNFHTASDALNKYEFNVFDFFNNLYFDFTKKVILYLFITFGIFSLSIIIHITHLIRLNTLTLNNLKRIWNIKPENIAEIKSRFKLAKSYYKNELTSKDIVKYIKEQNDKSSTKLHPYTHNKVELESSSLLNVNDNKINKKQENINLFTIKLTKSSFLIVTIIIVFILYTAIVIICYVIQYNSNDNLKTLISFNFNYSNLLKTSIRFLTATRTLGISFGQSFTDIDSILYNYYNYTAIMNNFDVDMDVFDVFNNYKKSFHGNQLCNSIYLTNVYLVPFNTTVRDNLWNICNQTDIMKSNIDTIIEHVVMTTRDMREYIVYHPIYSIGEAQNFMLSKKMYLNGLISVFWISRYIIYLNKTVFPSMYSLFIGQFIVKMQIFYILCVLIIVVFAVSICITLRKISYLYVTSTNLLIETIGA